MTEKKKQTKQNSKAKKNSETKKQTKQNATTTKGQNKKSKIKAKHTHAYHMFDIA